MDDRLRTLGDAMTVVGLTFVAAAIARVQLGIIAAPFGKAAGKAGCGSKGEASTATPVARLIFSVKE